MKKFKFRMETILKLKKQKEDEKKRLVGLLVAEKSEYERQAIEMSNALRLEGKKLKQHYLDNHVDLDEISSYQKYVIQIQQGVQQRMFNVTEVQKKLSIARQEFTIIAKETKILEKLKEKKLLRYKLDLRRLELIEEDDVATKVFLRNRAINNIVS
jgi:flagellar FliJ protein